MILIGIMRLEVIILEPNPLVRSISIFPLNIVQNIGWLTKHKKSNEYENGEGQ